MAIPSSIITGAVADLRLRQIGLAVEDIHESVRGGYAAAAGCTEHDPRSLPGMLIWGKGIGYLRDRTKPRGWRADRCMNYETAVHPSNSHAVTIAAGDSATGLTDAGPPRTKRPKGPATVLAVKQNNTQLQLGHGTDVFGRIGRDTDDEKRLTWLLLHYFDPKSSEIRLELSCPLAMTGAFITTWRERIILPPVAFGADLQIAFDDEEDEPIDIDVQRKAD